MHLVLSKYVEKNRFFEARTRDYILKMDDVLSISMCYSLYGKNKYWEIYMTECSTFRYVQKLLKTRSTVLVRLDQQSWKKYRTLQKYSVKVRENPEYAKCLIFMNYMIK